MSDALNIKGDIEVLRLQPGDVIVVNLEAEHIRQFEEMHSNIHPRLKETFPGHEIIYLANGIRLSVAREEVVA